MFRCLSAYLSKMKVFLTLICLPLNNDSSKAWAVVTESLSANSTYANLTENKDIINLGSQKRFVCETQMPQW